MDDFLIASPMTWDLFFEAARGALDETYKRVTEHVNPTSWAGDPNGRNPGHCGVKSPPSQAWRYWRIPLINRIWFDVLPWLKSCFAKCFALLQSCVEILVRGRATIWRMWYFPHPSSFRPGKGLVFCSYSILKVAFSEELNFLSVSISLSCKKRFWGKMVRGEVTKWEVVVFCGWSRFMMMMMVMMVVMMMMMMMMIWYAG